MTEKENQYYEPHTRYLRIDGRRCLDTDEEPSYWNSLRCNTWRLNPYYITFSDEYLSLLADFEHNTIAVYGDYLWNHIYSYLKNDLMQSKNYMIRDLALGIIQTMDTFEKMFKEDCRAHHPTYDKPGLSDEDVWKLHCKEYFIWFEIRNDSSATRYVKWHDKWPL